MPWGKVAVVVVLLIILICIIHWASKRGELWTPSVVLSILAFLMVPFSAFFEKYFVEPEIRGKMVSCVFGPDSEATLESDWYGHYEKKRGICYLVRLSITALNKDYNVKEIKIHVTYSYDPKKYEAIQFWAPYTIERNGRKYTLKTEKVVPELLLLGDVFQKDKVYSKYALFVVEKDNHEVFSTVEIEFVDYRNKHKVLRLNRDDINVNHLIYDETIWEQLEETVDSSMLDERVRAAGEGR